MATSLHPQASSGARCVAVLVVAFRRLRGRIGTNKIGSVPPAARFRGGCACRIGALTISARHADPMRGGWVMRHPNMENCGERTRSRLDGR